MRTASIQRRVVIIGTDLRHSCLALKTAES
jgi:hypothetical protein